MMRNLLRVLECLTTLSLLVVMCAGCSKRSGDDQPSVAYVSNGTARFFVIAERGAMAGGRDFNVDVQVRMPPNGVADQKRMVQDLLSRGTDGIAISPIDPDNQQDMLTEAANHTNLITQDSDAPDCGRLCYVGVDNYVAGRMCGALVKDVMPEGGTVVIFIGRIGQLNGRLRRQGVIDELLDRDHDSTRFDEAGKVLKGEKYTILDTCTDDLDTGRALAEAEDAISRFPELNCMVGLFDYNPPQCLQAIKKAGKLGAIHVVAFDEADGTLAGIAAGEIYGTIVQDPYRYGYESVRILAGLARGDKSVLPEGGFLDIPARKITKENVKEFWDELKRVLQQGEAAEESDTVTG